MAAAEAAMVLVVVLILVVVVAVIVIVVAVGKVVTKNNPRNLHGKVIYLAYIYHIDTQ
jgi:uncharacterized lipoprotein YehR (DUF1307 family)